jgi:hypothetical protein
MMLHKSAAGVGSFDDYSVDAYLYERLLHHQKSWNESWVDVRARESEIATKCGMAGNYGN